MPLNPLKGTYRPESPKSNFFIVLIKFYQTFVKNYTVLTNRTISSVKYVIH